MDALAPQWPEGPPFDEKVRFFSEMAGFDPPGAEPLIPWIEKVVRIEGARLYFVQFIFCSDEYLHQKNLEYLQHDTYTDVITFPYQDPPIVEGDIFISVERVHDNARQRNIAFSNELHRVMIHGVLHLCGYGDAEPADRHRMKEREDAALSLWQREFSPSA